jgi:hypothetical protein
MTPPSSSIWLKSGVTLALIAALYMVRVYNSFFDEQLAYFYEFAGDRVFEIRLGPHLGSCDRWLHLVPFQHCSFSQVNVVEYKGTLRDRIRTLAAEEALFKAGSTEELLKKTKGKIDRIITEIQSGELRSYDIAYFRNQGNTPIQLPEALSALTEFTIDKSEEVFLADVVISQSSLKGGLIASEVVRNALFIRGRPAHKLAEIVQ